MSMKTKAAILVTSFAVLLFMVVGGLGGVRASSNDGAYRQLQVYSEVLSRVNSEYVEEPNIPKVTDGALHGLLEALDPNSSYLSPKISGLQVEEERCEGRYRRRGFEAFWLRRRDLGDPGRTGGQGRH